MKEFIKAVYGALPLKKEIFTLLKKFWSPSQLVYQHLHFNGTIEVKVDDQHSFKIVHHGHTIENDLFWKGLFGNWEKHAINAWTNLCRESNVIFDIGANTGVYSLIAKSINPAANVHAFEPFEAICKKLEQNAAINHFSIHTNCLAVSNYSGDAFIYTADPEFAYSVTVNQNLWVKDQEPIKLDIKTITLKEYIDKNNVSAIDLMKIDVETHEPEVMEGFADFFTRFQPIILIEVLNEVVVEKLNKYFSDSGTYKYYHIDEGRGIKEVGELFKHKYYNFLIVPKEKFDFFRQTVLANELRNSN